MHRIKRRRGEQRLVPDDADNLLPRALHHLRFEPLFLDGVNDPRNILLRSIRIHNDNHSIFSFVNL